MANNIDWGKIYESTNFGNGRTDNTIDWGIVYKDLGAPAGDAPLLDTYSGALVAYSLRKLKSDYTGSAIQVTPNGSTFTDIGFDGSGNLDTASLPSDSNLYISKWYNQEGTAIHDMTQTSLASMPIIKSGGSVVTVKGKPAVDFATGRSMRMGNTTANKVSVVNKNLTQLLVTNIGDAEGDVEYLCIGTSSSKGQWRFWNASFGQVLQFKSGGQTWDFGYGGFNVDLMDPNIFIVTQGDIGGYVNFYQNAENPVTDLVPTVDGASTHELWYLTNTISVHTTRSKTSEYILWDGDYDSSVSDINTAVNDYYGTYTA